MKLPHEWPVIALMGPTGAGKTACALALAREFPLEIVSVDSALVYRGLDIGTAKPDPVQQRAVPHHLLDICDPTEPYSAARFRHDALAVIAGIRARQRVPLLVGGTGLYFRALQQGLTVLPAADPVLRRELEATFAGQGEQAMHQRLQQVDPPSAARIHPNDPQRVLRALEIFMLTGHAMSELLAGTPPTAAPFAVLNWVIAPRERTTLHARLATRFQAMLERGLINEVMGLRARPALSADTPAMRAVGYRAVWQYLAGELTFEQMVEAAVSATRQLAKRQYTWFRKVTDATWWDSEDRSLVSSLSQTFAEHLRLARSESAIVDYT
jgi:tRNA dimethylallyltransferase